MRTQELPVAVTEQPNKNRSILIPLLLLLVLLFSGISGLLFYQKFTAQPIVKDQQNTSQEIASSPQLMPVTNEFGKHAHSCLPANPIRVSDSQTPGWYIYIDLECNFLLKLPHSYQIGQIWYNTESDRSAGTYGLISGPKFSDLLEIDQGQEIIGNDGLPFIITKSRNLDLVGNQAVEIFVEDFPKDGSLNETIPCRRSVIVRRIPQFVGEENYIEIEDTESQKSPYSCDQYMLNKERRLFDEVITTFRFLDQVISVKS